MNWINPEQNLVGSVKQIQDILKGVDRITEDDNIYTIEQVENEFFKQGLTDTDAEKFYNQYKSQGWKKGNGLPITDLSSQVTNWRLNPKQYETKEDDKQADIRKALEYAEESRNRGKGKGIMDSVVASGTRPTGESVF